jgi:PAS domain S-box-containing protein
MMEVQRTVAESATGWTLAQAQGRSLPEVFRILNEESRQTVEDPAVRTLREGIVVGLANHTVLIAKDGTERLIDDSAAPIRNAAGNIAGVVLVFRDVTEKRGLERLSEASERRYRRLFETARDGILILDSQTA